MARTGTLPPIAYVAAGTFLNDVAATEDLVFAATVSRSGRNEIVAFEQNSHGLARLTSLELGGVPSFMKLAVVPDPTGEPYEFDIFVSQFQAEQLVCVSFGHP